MSDIEHWLESGAPSDVVEWLRAARAEQPSRRVVERVAGLVAAGGIATTTALASGTTKAGLSVLAKWGLLGFAAGCVVSGGVAVADRASTPVAPERAQHGLAKAPSTPRAAPVAVMPPTPTTTAVPAEPASAASTPVASARARPSAPRVSPDGRMSAELALLGRAQAAFDAGQLGTALALLEEHEQRFGSSAALSPEARYLKLELYAASARQDEARGMAQEILRRDAKGPHAGRARRVLEQQK